MINYKQLKRIVCFLLLIAFSKVNAQSFYVATTGSDTNNGSLAAPFKTLSKAKSVVRASLLSGGGITVYVRGGTYQLATPLEFDSQDSGGSTAPVTWMAYNNENVVISGAVTLSPTWTSYSGNIMVASIGTGYSFDVLFANDAQQVLARYPNYDANVAILNGYASDALTRISNWSNPTTGLVRGLHDKQWGGNSYKISEASGTLAWVGDNNRGSNLHTNYRMVENIFEELDAPGEWFYDKTSGKLYFYPPTGLNMATASFEGATAEELIRVVGNSTTKAGNLTFSNFTFTKTKRTLFTRPYELLLRSDWGVARAGAVFIQDAANVTVQNSNFVDLGGNAVFISGYNRNHLITNNEFTNIGATCVNLVGLLSAVRYPSSWSDHKTDIQDVIPGPLTDDYPKDITVSYNHMYNMGVIEKQTCGVNLSMSESITVSHNTIHKSPRAGINICDGTWGGHIIEYNDIFDCVRETSDHGPINAWGRDRFWSYLGYNTTGSNGAAKKPYAFLDAWKTTHIRNNRIQYNNPTSYGIDLDDGSSNYEIYNNLLLNTGIKLREGFGRKVYNNTVVNRQMDFHVWYVGCGDSFTKNIVSGVAAPYRIIGISATTIQANEFTASSNLFYNNGGTVQIGFTNWQTMGYDANSQTANPLFKDQSTIDYSVKSSSPALALGFVNFPMDQFGKPGSPTPDPISNDVGVTVESDAEPLMGASASSIYDISIQSAAGAANTNGVYLESVPTGSYAASQGFQVGDVILSINGTAITTKQSFWTVYHTLKPGSTVPITLLRNQIENPASFVKMIKPEKHNNTAGVVYSTNWESQKNTSSFNGDIQYNKKSGEYFSLTFYGTGISFISQKNTDMGDVEVYIDDVLKQTISCYNASQIHQQKVFSVNGLSEGLHTIKAVNTANVFQILDAFTIYSGPENIALSGTASQSTTAYSGDASRAIDGNTDGIYSNASVSHTGVFASGTWWMVTLDNTYGVGKIGIYNRTDSNMNRLSNFTVQVLNSAGNIVFTQTITSFPNPSITIDAGGAVGNRVRILQNKASTALALAEVEVYGTDTILSTRTELLEEKTLFMISPNPVKSMMNIKLGSTESATYKVFNMAGQIVLSGNIHNGIAAVDISSFAQGFYLIKVSNNSTTQTQKILKE